LSENSEVLPPESVAVAVTVDPKGAWLYGTLVPKEPFPLE
jgi:hypothetical protein